MRKHNIILLFIVVLLLVYFPVFQHMDTLPIRMWDESTTGVITNEMRDNNNYVVTYFAGADNLEYRPPLIPWCVGLLSKFNGFNELSLRLPSAIAAMLLCIFIFFAMHKYSGSIWPGFITVCVLVTSEGYVRNHVVRTGEYDSLLVTFSTLSTLSFFFAVQNERKQKRSLWLFLSFCFLTLALLSKGLVGLMPLPVLFIYTLFNGNRETFKNKGFLSGLLIFFLFGIGYYLLREKMNPGYLRAVYLNELGGRFGDALDGHEGPWYFYLSEIWDRQFKCYKYVLVIAVVSIPLLQNKHLRKLAFFGYLNAAFILLVISTAKTKLSHYSAPIFPYIAIVTAVWLYAIAKYLINWASNPKVAKAAIVIALALIYIKPYTAVFLKTYAPKGDDWEEGFSRQCTVFQDALHNRVHLNNTKLLFKVNELKGPRNYYGPPAVLQCYQRAMQDASINALVIYSLQNITPGDTVMVFDDELNQELAARFCISNTNRLDKYNAYLNILAGR